jgi:chromosomal replication initiation ATPase DnaA
MGRLALEFRHDRAANWVDPDNRKSNNARGLIAIDGKTAAAILEAETFLTTSALTLDTIGRGVAALAGIRLNLLRGSSRSAAVVEARHIAMHLARQSGGFSLSAIGKYFGGRKPASVRYACKMGWTRIDTNPTLTAAVSRLVQAWTERQP